MKRKGSKGTFFTGLILNFFVLLFLDQFPNENIYAFSVDEGGRDLSDCVVSAFNQTVPFNNDFSFSIFNVPAESGPIRIRVVCPTIVFPSSGPEDLRGEAIQLNPLASGISNLDGFEFGGVSPLIEVLNIVPSKPSLTSLGDTAQLMVTGTFDDGTTADVTNEPDTVYTTSNPNIATVSGAGLVTAVSSGTVVLSASKDGVLSTLIMMVTTGTGGDSDGDGIPDDYEIANGLNPNDPLDAALDPDGDGLTNLQEFQTGTDPNVSDTDGDGISDGVEVAGTNGFVTNPLLADTDGDGIQDLLEIQTGTDPTDPNSFNLAATLTSIDVTPPAFILAYNTVLNQDSTRQLRVTGNLIDGNTINLTSTSKGTNYTSSDLLICNFAPTEGEIFAGQDGICTITVTNSGFTDTVSITVETFSPTALSFVSIPGIAYNVDISGDYAYVAAGATGLQVVDVSDRSTPSIVASLDTQGNALDVKVVGNIAFIADGGAGLQVVDISNPLAPTLIGNADTPGQTFDLAIQGNFVFIADNSTGLQVVDVTNLGNPTLIRSVDTPGLAQGVDVRGNLLVVADGLVGVQVIDITDVTNPLIVGSLDTGNARDVVFSQNDNMVLIADIENSLTSVDISTPSTPVLIAATPRTSGGLLNDVALSGDLAFGADVFFINGVPVIHVGDTGVLNPRSFIDFIAFRDDDATGIALDGSFVYLTALKSGDSRLYIGQYLFFEDTAGIPPEVNITSPSPNETVIEGSRISVTVQATDDTQVISVDFVVDGQVVFTDTSAPYQFSVLVPVGATSLTVGAAAVDLGGNVGLADDVVLGVIPDPKTTVSGRVLDLAGIPIVGAVVSTATGQASSTLADGTFSITDVPTILGPIKVSASFTTQAGEFFTANSGTFSPIPGGEVLLGDLILELSIASFDFSGSSLPPGFNQVDFNGTFNETGGAIGNGVASVGAGVLQLSSSGSSAFPGGTIAKIRSTQALLAGDFDMIIDFDLVNLPAGNAGEGSMVGLGVTDLLGNDVFVGRYKDPATDGYIFSNVVSEVFDVPQFLANQPAPDGKLRLYRMGPLISAYYFDAAINEWVYLFEATTTTVPLYIEISTINSDTGQLVDAHFDNLKAEFVENIRLPSGQAGIRDLAASPLGQFFIGRYGDFNVLGDGGVFRVSPTGQLTPFSTLTDAWALSFGPLGDLFVADAGAFLQSQIFRITPAEELNIYVPGNLFFVSPRTLTGLTFDQDGFLYTGSGNVGSIIDFVYKISPDITVESLASGPDFHGFGVDSLGTLYTGGTLNGTIYQIPAGGTLTPLASGFPTPMRSLITVTPDDSLFFMSSGEVYHVDLNTGSSVKIGSGYFAGLTSDSNGNLYALRIFQGAFNIVRVRSATLK